jgi:hypothetical protein
MAVTVHETATTREMISTKVLHCAGKDSAFSGLFPIFDDHIDAYEQNYIPFCRFIDCKLL